MADNTVSSETIATAADWLAAQLDGDATAAEIAAGRLDAYELLPGLTAVAGALAARAFPDGAAAEELRGLAKRVRAGGLT